MSASKKKKLQNEAAQDQIAERELKKQEAEQKEKRTMRNYTLVGILCAVLCIGVLGWNSGLIQRNAAAITIDGQKYTAADVQYYYGSTRTSIITYYLQNFGFSPFDYQKSAKDQVYNSETGETWYDYLMSEAINSMKMSTAAKAAAEAEGITLSEEGKASMEAALEDLETVWIGSYPSRDAYLRAVYGPYMTYGRYVELLEQDMVAVDYTNRITDSFTYEDADYEAYYAEHADTLDNYTLSQFTLAARVETLDDEGKTIERTDEEMEALMEEAKAPVEAKAQEIKAALEAGTDPAVLSVQYADDLYNSSVHAVRTGANVNSSYSEWMYDTARQAGDVTMTEYDGGNVVYYYVAVYEGRARDDSATASVRHILVEAEQDEGADQPTDEQYDVAYDKAEALLKEWEAGEATEDTFAALATANSADPGSAANGGLITGINAQSSYVETFQNWALDPARAEGDTGIVQNTGSTTKGWHVMYFVGEGNPMWKLTADSAMYTEDYTTWTEDLLASYEVTEGFGMKFVQG